MMDLRLAYRIASMRPIIAGIDTSQFDSSGDTPRIKIERQKIIQSVKLNFDNIAQMYWDHSRLEWDVGEDIPNWAPPFSHFFAEWNDPEKYHLNGSVVNAPFKGQQGLFCLALDASENKDQTSNWNKFISHICGGGSVFENQIESEIKDILPQTKWILVLSPWITCSIKPICGHPMWMGYYDFAFIANNGKLLHWFAGGPEVHKIQAHNAISGLHTQLAIFGLGLSFCHCKNVVQKEIEDDRGEKWHKRSKVPRFTFKTLDIAPMREVLKREGKSDEVGLQRAIHICRGHFAHYTEDKPLFGKYVGTFWRPDHVRGSVEQGIVQKDYRVKTE